MLELILDEFQQINDIQHDQGLHQSQIYAIMMVTFDLTSSNTSQLGGLGKKLKELCKAVWEEDKASGSIPDWLGPVTDLPPRLQSKKGTIKKIIDTGNCEHKRLPTRTKALCPVVTLHCPHNNGISSQ